MIIKKDFYKEYSSQRRQAGILKKFLILIFIFLLFISISSIIFWKNFSSNEFLVHKIEEKINARVAIDKVKVNIFSFPAKVELQGVTLSARDKYARDKTILAKRTKFSNAPIYCKNISLSVNLKAILSQKLNLNMILIEGLKIDTKIEANGQLSILELFQPLKSVEKNSNVINPSDQIKSNQKNNKSRDIFSLTETNLDKLKFDNSQVIIKLQRDKGKIEFNNVDIKIYNIKIDTKSLQKNNKAEISINGILNYYEGVSLKSSTNLPLSSKLLIEPVLNKSESNELKFKPKIVGEIVLLKDGEFGELAAIKNLNNKIDNLSKKLKINLSNKNKGIDINKISQDSRINFEYNNGFLKIAKDAIINTPDATLSISESSWLDIIEKQHNANGRILFSESVSKIALRDAKNRLKKKLQNRIKELNDDEHINDLFSVITDESGNKIKIDFVSSGDISNPNFADKSSGLFIKKISTIGFDVLKKKIGLEGSKSLQKSLNKLLNKLR